MRTPVFYSWQSDTPAETGREFLRTALEAATRRIAADVEVSIRPELDHDTRGVPGSPTIAAAILKKIEECVVFVADVTLTHQRRVGSERLAPNPNVLLELGYGLPRLGWECVLMIIDADLGGPESLPFDLRGNRVLVYSSTEAQRDCDNALVALSAELENALRTIFGTAGPPADIATSLEVTLRYTEERIESARHDYRLFVELENTGSEIVSEWSLEVRFPKALLDSRKNYPIVEGSSTRDTAVMRRTSQEVSGTLYPGDKRAVLMIDYLMTHELHDRSATLFPQEITATVFVAGKPISRAEAIVRDLQVF